MKILIVGASGTLGQAVVRELGARHEIVRAGRSGGDLRIDLTDTAGIRAALAAVGPIDAVVSAAGNVEFAPLAALTPERFALGLSDKLMGQVNLALEAAKVLPDRGSITLIGGILSERYIVAGVSASMVNAGLEGFVRAASIEMPRGIRINLVSPGVFQESMPAYGPFFRGFEAIPVARAALAYSRSVEGAETGQVYRVL